MKTYLGYRTDNHEERNNFRKKLCANSSIKKTKDVQFNFCPNCVMFLEKQHFYYNFKIQIHSVGIFNTTFYFFRGFLLHKTWT